LTPRASLLALEQIGIKLGLEQIRTLLERLNHPDRAFPSVVIAGTNGKGSVTAMVERGLRASGYTTGRYISPHLVDLEERFCVNGVPLPVATVDVLAARIMDAARAMASPPSFFEATTALALEGFRDAAVNAAVLEVGLGGRLDATNAVPSRGVGITAVDYDHQAYLGHTIEEIAREKAGVIKPGGLVVLGENSAAVCRVVLDMADAQGARLIYAPEHVVADAEMTDGRVRTTVTTPHARYDDLHLGLRGWHQLANALTAIRLLEELTVEGVFQIGTEAITIAVQDVEWPARLELIGDGDQAVLIDGAHNPAAAKVLSSYILEVFTRPLPIVIGVMRDKNIAEMLQALAPAASTFICTSPDSPRAATPADIAALVAAHAPHIPAMEVPQPLEAVAIARTIGSPVVVAGSLYLAGEIRAKLT
jgi:dihydrofolate synthase/folylpolyglutamate synthase